MTKTISVRWNYDSGEYIVRVDGNRRTDYFASSPIDAIETADAMAEELQRNGPQDVDITVCATTRRRAAKEAQDRVLQYPLWYKQIANVAARVRFATGEPTMPKLFR